KDAADNHAQAVKIRAEANLRNYEVEAQGKAMINDAINRLSAEQIGMQVKLALIQALPGIIAESVKPVEKIDGIKIVQVDGLVKGGANGSGAAIAGNGGGSLADQAGSAALPYRAQQPIVGALLQGIRPKGGDLSHLTDNLNTHAASAVKDAPASSPAVSKKSS